jgi:DNA-binding response OmpR family regulator
MTTEVFTEVMQDLVAEPKKVAVEGVKNVLVAEDDPVSQEIIKEIITSLPNLGVKIVSDGGKAVELCASESYDLFILDLNLPTVKGNKILSFIRTSQRSHRNAPVILLSALRGEELSKVKGAALADCIMSKPFNLSSFATEIESLLKVPAH